MNEIELWHGDCLELMGRIPDQSIDAIITDPPYPEIDREYGRWSEADWHAMMRVVVAESRRVLNPTGSAVYILQPNSERVGRMRPWLWEFMAWTAREWNQVQDVWWWNFTSPPTAHCQRDVGLMRPSVKASVWLGDPDCHRNQDGVLWTESQSNATTRASDRCNNDLRRKPSGLTVRTKRMAQAAEDRGGVTPFNLLPIATDGSAGVHGHGAGTPLDVCDWWTRYICPPDGTILDPFMGSGTTAIAAIRRNCRYIGIERFDKYYPIAKARVAEELAKTSLFDCVIVGSANDE